MTVLRRRNTADGERERSSYEEFREQRIKENNERLKKLGLFELALKLKSPTTKTSLNHKPLKSLPLSTSPRRSSRLKTVNPINYSNKNFYTKSIYDSEKEKGESCHQCWERSLRPPLHCSNCRSTQGQFCGRCLKTRYGENVTEVNKNTNWICPVCRGICNCSSCRREKGLEPTDPYRKVLKWGFKSVAHYLTESETQQVRI